MVSRARRMIWLPSLLVGAATATGVATGAAVLLYDSQGLARAAAVLAAVTVLSLLAGLWMGAAGDGDGALSTAARWWMGLLVALLMGAGFAALWESMEGFGTVAVAQGLGLAFTGALPAYFAGGVWGRIGSFAGALGVWVRCQVVVGAVVGTAVGAALVLAVLGRPVLAVTAFLAATVFASGGARCQGWIFDRLPRRHVVLRKTGRPELRFETWQTAVPKTELRVLRDEGRRLAIAPPPGGDWRRTVASSLDPAGAVLFVGVGGWFSRDDLKGWWVYEPDGDVAALAAEGFAWPDGSLVGSPVPDTPGCSVVVDWEQSGDALVKSFTIPELLAGLREAKVERVWIGLDPDRLPPALAEAAARAGFGVTRYAASVAGVAGLPRMKRRRKELWRLDRSGTLPGPVSEARMPGGYAQAAESEGH